MIAFRIGSAAHPLLDGAGAASSGAARWNSRGRSVIYASEHYATALLEKAAQLNTPRIPRALVYISIYVPIAASVEEVLPSDLPAWDSESKIVSQDYGDRWFDEQRSLILLVPSLAAPGLERNVLINQHHPEFAGVIATAAVPIRCHPKLLV